MQVAVSQIESQNGRYLSKLSIWLKTALGKMFDNRTFANNYTLFDPLHAVG